DRSGQQDEPRNAVAEPGEIEPLGHEPARRADDDDAAQEVLDLARAMIVDRQEAEPGAPGRQRYRRHDDGEPGDGGVDDEGADDGMKRVGAAEEQARFAEEEALQGNPDQEIDAE